MVKKNQKQIPANLQPWIDARRRFHLSHEHVQMARELGMNPKKLGKLDNHDQEPCKLPLPEFIRKLYSKHFGKERPDAVRSIKEMVVAKQVACGGEPSDRARRRLRRVPPSWRSRPGDVSLLEPPQCAHFITPERMSAGDAVLDPADVEDGGPNST
jgi:hypothetical protein